MIDTQTAQMNFQGLSFPMVQTTSMWYLLMFSPYMNTYSPVHIPPLRTHRIQAFRGCLVFSQGSVPPDPVVIKWYSLGSMG